MQSAYMYVYSFGSRFLTIDYSIDYCYGRKAVEKLNAPFLLFHPESNARCAEDTMCPVVKLPRPLARWQRLGTWTRRNHRCNAKWCPLSQKPALRSVDRMKVSAGCNRKKLSAIIKRMKKDDTVSLSSYLLTIINIAIVFTWLWRSLLYYITFLFDKVR